jgi:sec-independent protein translocase protein TatA
MGVTASHPALEANVKHLLIALPQVAEWLVILAIVILIFGAAKLPDLARSSGQALRIFRTETRDVDDESSREQASSLDSSPHPLGSGSIGEQKRQEPRTQP